MIRRLLICLLLSLPILSAGATAVAARQAIPLLTGADHILGDPNAPVTVIEYGSLACPHCAEWQMAHFYDFKGRFVDTRQVRFVFRDVLTEPTREAAAAAAIARCSAPDRYFEVLHTLFRWQSTARNIGPVDDWYERGIADSGRDPAAVRACSQDPATLEAINASMRGGLAAGVTKTPTFFVNGRMTPDGSMETLGAAIDAASRSSPSAR